jgi:hypothetical protein
MSSEEAHRTLLETPEADTNLLECLINIEQKLDLLLSAIAIPQQHAADLSGVHRDTFLNKAKKRRVGAFTKRRLQP